MYRKHHMIFDHEVTIPFKCQSDSPQDKESPPLHAFLWNVYVCRDCAEVFGLEVSCLQRMPFVMAKCSAGKDRMTFKEWITNTVDIIGDRGQLRKSLEEESHADSL